jgi:hypothetical protein
MEDRPVPSTGSNRSQRQAPPTRPLRRWFAASAPALASTVMWTLIEGSALLRNRLRRVA